MEKTAVRASETIEVMQHTFSEAQRRAVYRGDL